MTGMHDDGRRRREQPSQRIRGSVSPELWVNPSDLRGDDREMQSKTCLGTSMRSEGVR